MRFFSDTFPWEVMVLAEAPDIPKNIFSKKKLVFRKNCPRTAKYANIIGNASRSSENGPETDLSRHYHEFESTLSRRALSTSLLPTVIPERSEGLLFHQASDFHRIRDDRNSSSKKAKRLATPVIAIEICLWGFV